MTFLIVALPTLNVKRVSPTYERLDMLDPKTLTKRLKTIFGAHHYMHVSDDIADIAAVVNLSPEDQEKLMRSSYWRESLDYWGFQPELGDLKIAQQLWTELVEKREDVDPVEYPDQQIGKPFYNYEVRALINSHLFCIDNLSNTDIRDRLADDGNPVHYESQHIRGYHWFVYPNKPLYSKALAKVNVAGDLVIDYGDDETCLVCIKHGRLSITRQVFNDVVSVNDSRLLVCL